MTTGTSRIPGFYKMSISERQERVAAAAGLNGEENIVLQDAPDGGLDLDTADRMVENCVGLFSLPMGIGVNLRIDGRDRLVPMVVEEPSVVAALSNAAKFLREGEGIRTEATQPEMIGQIQVLDIPSLELAKANLEAHKRQLLEDANACHPNLRRRGGGARDIELRTLEPMRDNDPLGTMLIVHLLVDVRDAMGANIINTMAEALAPTIAALTGGRTRLRILSNLTDRRTVTCRGRVSYERLGGGDAERGHAIAKGIEEASVMAERDPYRAATHNKGVMNGVDSVLIATGQDWRAIEAGAHAYAVRDGRYTALSRWRCNGTALEGEMTLPMAVGIVGGAVKTHPLAKLALRIIGVESATELGAIAACCGLAQNLAALRALATEGINRGHMGLHARNIAVAAGAEGPEVDRLAAALAKVGRYNSDVARDLLAQLRRGEDAGAVETAA